MTRMLPIALRRLVLVAFAAALSACGGGGSGGGLGDTGDSVADEGPQAVVFASPQRGTAPLGVLFDGQASHGGNSRLVEHLWEFGPDDEPAVGAVVSHTFTEPGSHVISLTVTDERGRSDRRETIIDVDEPQGTFTVSGRIRILRSSAVDSDVNDPNMPPASNNSFADAQELPNPVTLGGFINVPGSGDPDGNLFETGDPGDFYHIELSGQDSIVLTVGDPQSSSLALYLWKDGDPPELVDSVMINGDAGTLRPPAGGSYFVEVSANAGASTYVLHVGQDLSLTMPGGASPRLSDDFVPGELIIVEDDARPARDRRPRLARLGRGQPEAQRRAWPRGLEHARGLRDGGKTSARALAKLETLAAIQRYNQQHDHEFAEPNYIRRALLADDPFLDFQWHYPGIELFAAWELTHGSSDVIVAVVDTGVLVNHPDLRNEAGLPQKLLPGFNFISDPARARNEDGIGPDPDDPGDLAFGGSSSFHGTHVAGTIGARTNNGVGVAGVSWHARIMPLRALGVGGGTSYDVMQAIRYAAGMSNDSETVPERPADIINLSIGGTASSLAEQNLLQAVRERGIFVVASAGNRASAEPFFPASYPGVISVSATTISRELAPYSNFGSSVDLAAPGGNNQTDLNADGIGDGVVSTIGDDSSGSIRFGYASLMGTSMAAPHVSGVIALMKAVHDELTPDQFDALLQSMALTDDLGTPGRNDEFGFGLVNARRAVQAALELSNGSDDAGPLLSGTPVTFNLGVFDSEFDVELRNVGGGALSITSVTTDRPWLSASPVDVDANNLGTYRVQADRDLLADEGTFLGSVKFASTANDIAISVVLQKSEIDFDADAGLHYVVLVDATDYTSVAATAVRAVDGEYEFAITDVSAGRYRLFAGTDLDNDGFICDGGEACGAYRTLHSPEVILVNGTLHNLDFVSGFRSQLFSPSSSPSSALVQGVSVPQQNLRPEGDAD
jgi:serine protease